MLRGPFVHALNVESERRSRGRRKLRRVNDFVLEGHLMEVLFFPEL